MTNYAGIVLCGGRSRRMGVAKAWLPFGPETMLERIIRRLSAACGPIVVVAAPGQPLPSLPEDVIVARDRREGRGPLEGLRAGLAALPPDVEAAYATGCDAPFLAPALVRRMFELLGEHAIAVPVRDGAGQTLAAVYRRRLVDAIDELLAEDRLALRDLFDVVPTRRVEEREVADVEGSSEALQSLNHPDDYLAALKQAGFEPPADLRALFGEAE